MPNRALSSRVRAAMQRRAHREVRSIARLTAPTGAPAGGHSSKAIMMSLPRVSWMPMASSGVRRCGLPSMWDAKVTPCSSMRARCRRLKTWNPPLSVRIGWGQAAIRWRPPRARTTSIPGRR